ncbi:MAG: lysophospholipid acyltransferase family protein [Pseudooceanicola sp.]|nr:lysophospholipid acyltransferase family protein [Pseudooceanicola sp.]
MQHLAIQAFLGTARLLPFRARGNWFATAGRFAIPRVPSLRNRMAEGMRLVYPDLTEAELSDFIRRTAANTSRTFSEILFNKEYARHLELFHPTGPGLDVLRRAKAEGQGVLIVSAHLGQWEAIRHYLRDQGMETGAMYRLNENPWYEKTFLANIEQAGLPIIAKSRTATIQMIRHIRKGGFFAMLADQKHRLGYKLPFLGHDAMTTVAPATLANRYGFPVVPCFGIRRANGFDIDVIFEEPLTPADVLTMTREMNDRISAQIRAHPDQWHWLHRRWSDLHYHDLVHGAEGDDLLGDD